MFIEKKIPEGSNGYRKTPHPKTPDAGGIAQIIKYFKV
jgi:hypothetical protein